jgi:hypothetical protein
VSGVRISSTSFRGGHLIRFPVYAAGIVFRFVYRKNFNSLGIFLIQNLFIILSPCAFIASVYAILGQLATRIDADNLVPIKPARIAKIFVWSGQYHRDKGVLHPCSRPE